MQQSNTPQFTQAPCLQICEAKVVHLITAKQGDQSSSYPVTLGCLLPNSLRVILLLHSLGYHCSDYIIVVDVQYQYQSRAVSPY